MIAPRRADALVVPANFDFMAASRTDEAQAFHLAVISLYIRVIDFDVDAHRESSVKQRCVARVERSEIRAQPTQMAMLSPDVASLHPGYKCSLPSCSRHT
jgi:hypothetical protein